VLFRWQGWGTAVFTVLYLGSVSFYLFKRCARLSRAGWFWLGITLLTGLSIALWDASELAPYRALFIFCSAVYWVLCATGNLLSGKTGDRLPLDGINAVLFIPARNFGNQYKSLGYLGRADKSDTKKALPVILGIALAVIILVILIPLLLEADSGGFAKIIDALSKKISIKSTAVINFLIYLVPAIPAAAYIFGLASGSASKRGTDTFKAEGLDKASLNPYIAAATFICGALPSSFFISYLS
jgi:hypothetical protein